MYLMSELNFICLIDRERVRVMVFDAIFNNISVIYIYVCSNYCVQYMWLKYILNRQIYIIVLRYNTLSFISSNKINID